jgi:hypothetical protein
MGRFAQPEEPLVLKQRPAEGFVGYPYTLYLSLVSPFFLSSSPYGVC